MSDKTQLMLLVLYEEELRTAASLLRKCVDAQETDEFPQAAFDALNACCVALSGLEQTDRHPVLLSASKNIVSRIVPEKRNAKRKESSTK